MTTNRTRFRSNRRYPTPITVTDDPKSHTLALQQILEMLNTATRRTRDSGASFVRLEELEDLGLIEIVGDGFNPVVPTGSTGPTGPAEPAENLLYAYQAADHTVTNTTLVDSALSVALTAGTYIIEIMSQWQSHATPDVQCRLNFTGTSANSRFTLTSGTSNSAQSRTVNSTNIELTTTATTQFISWSGTLEVTGSGTFSLQFAQATTSAGNPIGILRGSWLRASKVA